MKNKDNRELPNWYAVHTKPRQESLAKEHLERQNFHVYLPLIRAAKRRSGGMRSVIEPLFPGYLFVEIDIESQHTAPIRSTRGVLGLVRFGGQLLSIPRPVIEALIGSQPDPSEPIDLLGMFKSGDEVVIVEGPFTGLKAIFEAATGEERVCLLLDMLGRQNRVIMKAHEIAPTS